MIKLIIKTVPGASLGTAESGACDVRASKLTVLPRRKMTVNSHDLVLLRPSLLSAG